MDGRATLDLAPDLARVGQPLLLLPRPRDLDARDLLRRALDVKRPVAFEGGHARSSRHVGARNNVKEVRRAAS